MADIGNNEKEKEVQKEAVSVEKAPVKTTSVGEYREANTDYMKSMFPEAEINDDNYPQMLEKTLGSVIPKMKSYDEANSNLKAMMHGEPKLTKILTDMSMGAKFEEALPRYLDTNELKLMPGDPDYTQWEANNKTRKVNFEAEQEYKKKLSDNKKRSEVTMKNWYEKKGMDDGAKTEYGSFVATSLDKAYSGDIDEEFLDKMYYAMNYKTDVKKAQEVGELKGKNAKIVTEKLAEDKKLSGDGMPVIEGGAAAETDTGMQEEGNALERGLRKRSGRKSIISGNS